MLAMLGQIAKPCGSAEIERFEKTNVRLSNLLLAWCPDKRGPSNLDSLNGRLRNKDRTAFDRTVL
jgi:hypothetical protein